MTTGLPPRGREGPVGLWRIQTSNGYVDLPPSWQVQGCNCSFFCSLTLVLCPMIECLCDATNQTDSHTDLNWLLRVIEYNETLGKHATASPPMSQAACRPHAAQPIPSPPWENTASTLHAHCTQGHRENPGEQACGPGKGRQGRLLLPFSGCQVLPTAKYRDDTT